jgi:hypothetical protein
LSPRLNSARRSNPHPPPRAPHRSPIPAPVIKANPLRDSSTVNGSRRTRTFAPVHVRRTRAKAADSHAIHAPVKAGSELRMWRIGQSKPARLMTPAPSPSHPRWKPVPFRGNSSRIPPSCPSKPSDSDALPNQTTPNRESHPDSGQSPRLTPGPRLRRSPPALSRVL